MWLALFSGCTRFVDFEQHPAVDTTESGVPAHTSDTGGEPTTVPTSDTGVRTYPELSSQLARDGATVVHTHWPGEPIGSRLAAGEDYDGDGLPDLFAGDPSASTALGAVWFLPGVSTSAPTDWRLLSGITQLTQFGLDLHSFPGGVVVGTGYSDETAYIFRGRWDPALAPSASANAIVQVQRRVSSLAAGPDVDGDTTPDIALLGSEALEPCCPGTAFLFSTEASGVLDSTDATLTVVGEAGDYLNGGIEMVHDLDGDGRSEIAVGTLATGPEFDGFSGAVALLRQPVVGQNHISSADAVLRGEPGDDLGWYLDGQGDLDGDGATDLVLSATQIVGSSVYGNGEVFIWTRTPSGEVPVRDGETGIEGEFSMEFGRHVASGGDADGDGQDDLLVNATGSGEGHVYLIHGPIPAGSFDVRDVATIRFDGSGSNTIANEAEFMGDLDGDGSDEFVIGGPSFGSAASEIYIFYGPW